MKFEAVSFDIDGTLTLGHGWYYIAEALGKSADYAATTSRFRAGAIGEGRHLANLLNIAAGTAASELYPVLARTPKIENIAAGMRRLKEAGLGTFLLTHNPGYVCRWYAGEFGIDGYEGARQNVRGGIVCRVHDVRPEKVAWMRKLCRRERISPESLIHVGDSTSDAEVFGNVGMGIALNSNNRLAIAGAAVSLNTADMIEVVETILEKLS